MVWATTARDNWSNKYVHIPKVAAWQCQGRECSEWEKKKKETEEERSIPFDTKKGASIFFSFQPHCTRKEEAGWFGHHECVFLLTWHDDRQQLRGSLFHCPALRGDVEKRRGVGEKKEEEEEEEEKEDQKKTKPMKERTFCVKNTRGGKERSSDGLGWLDGWML